MPIPGQTAMFTPTLSYNVNVSDICRRIMRNKPVSFRSHRLLMKEVAREMGMDWIDKKLTSEERSQLEMLLDLSPDFERRSRKVREEDEARKSGAMI